MIRAIFFDIDGTLKPFDEHELRDTTVQMLADLQAKGIRVFIASGRPPVQLPLLGNRFNSFPWDGMVLLNGQYCLNKEKEVIHNMPIPKEALHSLVPWLKEHADYPCSFFELDRSYDITFNQNMYDYLKSLGQEDKMPKIMDPVRSYENDTYQICPYIPPEGDDEFVSHAPGMKSARWTDEFADMIPEKGGKPAGIQAMIDYYGIDRSEIMAFGDGGNDSDMLEFAEIGVAMGNAKDEIKAHADYVTIDCKDDGILHALRHFNIL